MQRATVSTEFTPTKSTTKFMPLIDLDPNSESCIFSSLLYIQEQATKLQIRDPCVTFDQPLWLKATKIIKATKLRIVCRLGGFHTLMSFMGSLGNLMRGSGLKELLQEVYATKTVEHICSGKAYSRAIRAHFLVHSALTTLLIEIVVQNSNLDIKLVQGLYEKALNKQLDAESVKEFSESPMFNQVLQELAQTKKRLKAQSRTAALWIQYMDYVQVLKSFIFAERTSNWHLHLSSLSSMLNLFAATQRGIPSMPNVADYTCKRWRNYRKIFLGCTNSSSTGSMQYRDQGATSLASRQTSV